MFLTIQRSDTSVFVEAIQFWGAGFKITKEHYFKGKNERGYVCTSKFKGIRESFQILNMITIIKRIYTMIKR